MILNFLYVDNKGCEWVNKFSVQSIKKKIKKIKK